MLEYAERMKRYSILERALDETERRKADSAMQPQGKEHPCVVVRLFSRAHNRIDHGLRGGRNLLPSFDEGHTTGHGFAT